MHTVLLAHYEDIYLLPAFKKLLDHDIVGNLQEIHVSLGLGRLCWSHIHSIDLISFYLGRSAITDVRAVAMPDSFQSEKFNLDGDPFINFMRPMVVMETHLSIFMQFSLPNWFMSVSCAEDTSCRHVQWL